MSYCGYCCRSRLASAGCSPSATPAAAPPRRRRFPGTISRASIISSTSSPTRPSNVSCVCWRWTASRWIHLVLGNLFSQRGEVDRAIRIHQNLIARSTLNKAQRAQALLELAQDYTRAGLLDRAESLCQELIEMKEHLPRALNLLSDIYQQEKEWERAIEVTRRLQSVSDQSMDPVIAQFYCEQAEQARDKGDTDAALNFLKRALAADGSCVRASMIQGEIAVAAGDCKGAIRAFQQIERQDAAYMPEIIPALVDCYRARGDIHELFDYLDGLWARHGDLALN